MTNHRILVVSPHPIQDKMAGPAIRYWQFADHLSRVASVRLAAPNESSLPHHKLFEVVSYHQGKLHDLIEKSDVVLVQGYLLAEYPFIQETKSCLIVDLYDPYPLEDLAVIPSSSLGEELYRSSLYSLLLQILRGDFFLCASERQRDFWLGMLTALGRVNPATYQSDVTFEKLITVVPFGLPLQPPVKSRRTLKGVISGIQETDKLVLWGGGIYDWLDPLTPIKAIKEISSVRNDVKLYFMGLAHPSQGKISSKQISAAKELATKLDLIDRFVFFNSEWVSYEDRQNYLLEADIGISTHPEHIEARFSYRTRILDYIWAGLPILCTNGDSLSEIVEKNQLGKTVNPGDVNQVASAILSILSTSGYHNLFRERCASLSSNLSWENAVRPLVKYCSKPEPAVDRTSRGASTELHKLLQQTLMKNKSLLRVSWQSLREEGFDSFLGRAQAYLKRRANK